MRASNVVQGASPHCGVRTKGLLVKRVVSFPFRAEDVRASGNAHTSSNSSPTSFLAILWLRTPTTPKDA